MLTVLNEYMVMMMMMILATGHFSAAIFLGMQHSQRHRRSNVLIAWVDHVLLLLPFYDSGRQENALRRVGQLTAVVYLDSSCRAVLNWLNIHARPYRLSTAQRRQPRPYFTLQAYSFFANRYNAFF